MRRVFFILILLFPLCVTHLVAQGGELSVDNINRIALSVVYIEALNDDVLESTGSGTIMTADGMIYTNRHVVEDAEDFYIFLAEDLRELPVPRYYASIVRVFDEIDLAILQIDRDADGNALQPGELELPFLEATSDKINYGDTIRLFGYPDIGDGYLVVSEGTITTIENGTIYGERLPVWYRTDAEMSSGNSGGLVVNEAGEFIGIPTWIRKADTTLGQLGGILPYPAIRIALSSEVADVPAIKPGTLVLENDTDNTICYVYLASTSSTSWGDDLLGSDNVIAPGEQREFSVEQGVYDLLLQNCDKQTLEDQRELTLDDRLLVTYTGEATSQALTDDTTPLRQALTVELLDIEYDAPLEGETELGIMVYAYVRATGYQDIPLRTATFYYWRDGTPISGENALEKDRDEDGNLTVQLTLNPTYEDSEWTEVWFWMPYSAFPDLTSAKEEAYVEASLGIDGAMFKVTSGKMVFTLRKQEE